MVIMRSSPSGMPREVLPGEPAEFLSPALSPALPPAPPPAVPPAAPPQAAITLRAAYPARRPEGATGDLEQVRITSWVDHFVECVGYDLRSEYVETFWLGILGPTTTLLLRRLAAELELSPGGFVLHLEDASRELGLGYRRGRNAPLRRALERAVTFGAARHLPGSEADIAVRRKLAPVPPRQLARLPEAFRARHAELLALVTKDSTSRNAAFTSAP